MNEPKQVIIIRRDLDMSIGKAIAQGAHASVAAVQQGSFVSTLSDDPSFVDYLCIELKEDIEEWSNGSHTKIVLGVDSEEEMLDLYSKAQNAGLRRSIIKDEGRTELRGQNYTAMAIGPADPEKINAITGHLKLL